MIMDLIANFIRILAVDSVEFFISLSKVFQLAPMHLLLVIVLLHLLVTRVTVEDHALWVANVAGLASLLAEQGARGLSEVASNHHVSHLRRIIESPRVERRASVESDLSVAIFCLENTSQRRVR